MNGQMDMGWGMGLIGLLVVVLLECGRYVGVHELMV
jgi:hypothetical protein